MTQRNAEAEALRAEATQHDQARADSIERSDTDGFLSQWASGISAQLARAKAEILDAGGVAEFNCVTDVDGREIPSRLINSAYGYCYALTGPDGRFTGVFVPLSFGPRSKHWAAGLRIGTVKAPAIAKTYAPANARGLSGASQVSVIVERVYE